jgi:DoxX-like family
MRRSPRAGTAIGPFTNKAGYLVPQTSVLAAIVMTGYLGGAVATHLRIADTARAAIPLVVGILAWGGLYLRDSRIRQLVPFRRPS